MTRILGTAIAAVIALVSGFVLAPAATADQPYAFAVQPDGCTPGYVHINHSPDVTWALDGDPVEVSAPSTNFPFPGGFQGDATATGAESGTYYLTVNAIAASCYPPVTDPTPTPTAPTTAPVAPAVDLAYVIADLKVERTALQNHITNLRREIRHQDRVIRHQDRVIARLRAKVARLR